MISIHAVHAAPTDPSAFDDYYDRVHIPLVQRIPGVIGIRYGRTLAHSEAPTGDYLVCDTYFADRASLDAALASPEMAEALNDLPNFSTGGVRIFFADVADHAVADRAA
jgi:uncharacterized protein (TIGR02118 family)